MSERQIPEQNVAAALLRAEALTKGLQHPYTQLLVSSVLRA